MSTIYEVPIGSTRRITIDWEEWINDLPDGQALDTVVWAFDGGAGSMTLSNDGISGYLAGTDIVATSGVAGFYYLKATATSNASPNPYVEPVWVQVRVVAKLFVEEVED